LLEFVHQGRQEWLTNYDNRSLSSRFTEIGKQLQRIFEGREVIPIGKAGDVPY
jgi:hypothetical protein